MNTTRLCPVCNSISAKPFRSFDFRCFDAINPLSFFTVAGCLQCGIVFNDLDVNPSAIEQFYLNNDFYASNVGVGSGGLSLLDQKRYTSMLTCLREIRPTLNSLRVADIGCAKGGLLRFLKTEGIQNLFAVDINRRQIDTLSNDYGIAGACGSTDALPLPAGSADILIYSNILEHVYSFTNVVLEMHRVLNDNGIVIIEIPDCDRYAEFRISDFYWFSQSEHINHLNRNSLLHLMSRYNFAPLQIENDLQQLGKNGSMPIIRAIFAKQKTSETTVTISFNSITNYIEQESKKLDIHRKIVSALKKSRSPLFIWGKGLELQLLYSETELPFCNINCIIDNNLDKQKLKVNNISILSQDALVNATTESTVVLSSALHYESMLEHLHTINYTGTITSLV